jgi:hypothetical protein
MNHSGAENPMARIFASLVKITPYGGLKNPRNRCI